jgi:hypothetical protein
MRKVHHAGC